VTGRQVQQYGGAVTQRGYVMSKLPRFLEALAQKVHRLLGPQFFQQAPTHVLVNKYYPGQGILPHEDGPKYAPVVAILSLGAPVVFRFTRHLDVVEVRSGLTGLLELVP
jgi:alkylated DNA repair protein alkB homolog 6